MDTIGQNYKYICKEYREDIGENKQKSFSIIISPSTAALSAEWLMQESDQMCWVYPVHLWWAALIFCTQKPEGRTSPPPGLNLSNARPTPGGEGRGTLPNLPATGREQLPWSSAGHPLLQHELWLCGEGLWCLRKVCTCHSVTCATGHVLMAPFPACLQLKCCRYVSHQLEICCVHLSPPQFSVLSPAPWSAADWWHRQGQQCSGVHGSLIWNSAWWSFQKDV